jgi:hypothetical protein
MTQTHTCIHCGRDDSQVPVVVFYYKDQEHHICTEHFPVLIHRPTELTGKLPDMDKLNPVDHD